MSDDTRNVYQRLNDARQEFHSLKLTKTGENKFAGYKYFELGDFLIPAMQVFGKHGLCAIVSFEAEEAYMRIVDVASCDHIVIRSPMGSAALKGCHEVQNIGAVETYQRRYLWVAALEIVEHDALDATMGKEEPATGKDEPVREPGVSPETAKRSGEPKQDIPFPKGPAKNITALKDKIRSVWDDVPACTDLSTFDALEASNDGYLKQCAIALPAWWYGWKDKSTGELQKGLHQTLRDKRAELESLEADDQYARDQYARGESLAKMVRAG